MLDRQTAPLPAALYFLIICTGVEEEEWKAKGMCFGHLYLEGYIQLV